MENAERILVERGTENEELVKAVLILSRESDYNILAEIIVKLSLDITGSDLAAIYLINDLENNKKSYNLKYSRGGNTLPDKWRRDSELVPFIEECREAVIVMSPDSPGSCNPFCEALLHCKMNSGIVLPIFGRETLLGLLFVNSRKYEFYNRSRFRFLDSFTKLAGELLGNSIYIKKIENRLKRLEARKEYNEGIFTSLPDLILILNRDGSLYFFNEAAAQCIGLSESDLKTSIDELLKKSFSRETGEDIISALCNNEKSASFEGIYKNHQTGIDYRLNISPLCSRNGEREGTTLFFTTQTRELEK